jgi:hypothetical protein
LDPVVHEREIAARREFHLDPVVRERENAAWQEIHETERLDPDVRERENVARRELHLDPVVRERENAARRELHLDPVVHERENVARRKTRESSQDWPGLLANHEPTILWHAGPVRSDTLLIMSNQCQHMTQTIKP